MFRDKYQKGPLSILYGCGKSPLELWDMHVRNGFVRRVMDNEINSLAIEIAGTNVSTAYIYTPKNQSASLGISLPFIIIMLKNMKRYFTMEITILDEDGMHRRFKLSNFQSKTKIRPFSTTMPIGLGCGWNQIQLNMVELVKIAYGTIYKETTRLQIHANCRIRRIYFADRLYIEDELPEEYRISFTKTKPENKDDKKDQGSIHSKSSVNRSFNSQISQENKTIGNRSSFNSSEKGEENPRLEVRIPITEYDEDRSEQTNRDSVIDGEFTTELSEKFSNEEEDETDNEEMKGFNEAEEKGIDEKDEIDEEADDKKESDQDEEVESKRVGQQEEKTEEIEEENDETNKKEKTDEEIDIKNKKKLINNLDKDESLNGVNLNDDKEQLNHDEELNMNKESNNNIKELIKTEIKSELDEKLDKNYEYQQTY